MEITYEKISEIIDLYKDSEHPINEVLSAMKDNIYWEFFDEENLSKSELSSGASAPTDDKKDKGLNP